MQLAALELAQTHELRTILQTWAQNQIHPLLLKGTPLAYSLYPEPWLRERCDTDVLFASREDAKKAHALLEDMGYQQPNAVSGDYISHQFMSYRNASGGIPHTLDMHWRINNTWAFANAFTFDELQEAAIDVPRLGPAARSLSPAHALLLACMHRAGHISEGTANRLICLYDMHLLSKVLSEEDWDEFGTLAHYKGLGEICMDSLDAVRKAYGSEHPEGVLQVLSHSGNCIYYAPMRAQSRVTAFFESQPSL